MSTSTWSYDPYKLAALHRTLDGKVAVAEMFRAVKILSSDQGELDYNVEFATDGDNICVITGRLQGQVTLCCQRCIQPFVYDLACKFVNSPVLAESDAKQLPATYEEVLLRDGKVDLLELLEDELILALPQVPMHAPNNCAAAAAATESATNTKQEVNQPFQILQKLKFKNTGPIAED